MGAMTALAELVFGGRGIPKAGEGRYSKGGGRRNIEQMTAWDDHMGQARRSRLGNAVTLFGSVGVAGGVNTDHTASH